MLRDILGYAEIAVFAVFTIVITGLLAFLPLAILADAGGFH